jgi:ankyrin repeat protein
MLLCLYYVVVTLCIQEYGVTALATAAMKGHEQVVDVLLKAGANPNIMSHVCCNPDCWA